MARELSSASHSAAHEERRRLTLSAVGEALTASRRNYVDDFVRAQGFEGTSLNDEQVRTVFGLLSRLEELGTLHKHTGQNWELCYAPLSRQRNVLTPVVDVLLRDWACQGLLRPLPSRSPLWPKGKRFALCLTHDVDHVSGNLAKERLRSLPTFREAPGREKLIVGLSTARTLALKTMLWKPAPDPPLDIWLAEEEKHGFRSSLFFLASPLPAPHWKDSFYSYDDRVTFEGRRARLRDVMAEIANRGWDVGLHGASRSSESAALLASEKALVERASGTPVVSTRQHHLFFDTRYTPHYQHMASIQADSTIGSNIAPGFRCGTCFPYFLFDLYTDRPLDVLEAPLVIQDVALFNQLDMDESLALAHCIELMEEVANVNGVLTVLWHNDVDQTSPRFRVYSELLRIAADCGAWGCSLADLNGWWRSRLASTPVDAAGAHSAVPVEAP